MILTGYITNTRTKRKLYGIAGALITLAIPFYISLHNAGNHIETEQSFCPFKMLTGFPCPGCGITKSLVYFYEGDWYKSISYHILGPFVVLFALFTTIVLTTELLAQKEYFSQWLYNRKLAYALGISLGIYHVVRIVLFIMNNSWDSILHQSIWR